jgi:hypothetical protein
MFITLKLRYFWILWILCLHDLLDCRQLYIDTNHYCHTTDEVASICKTVMALLSRKEYGTYVIFLILRIKNFKLFVIHIEIPDE